MAETGRLIDRDTIRVYRVDHATGWCEPLAFEGRFLGTTNPTAEQLRLPIGEGLTGWVAANDRSVRSGDAANDPRGRIVGKVDQPESMLVVPMSIEEVVHGVIVVSALGRDRFDHDDELTLTIFASYAAQAMLNATNVGRLHRQQAELEHQLDGQRRLLEVNERLLATLDPVGVLDLIADSLKAIVPYDSLTVYRVDREAGTRRAVLARDLYADEILADEPSMSGGLTGWAIEHGEAVLANEAHLDPRSVQVPGTPFEPEAMILVPLIVGGEVIGTLNVGRLGGEEAHFSENEFELTKLFAGQASIALQNAQAHGEVQVRAEQDALTGLRNHGAFQRELSEAVRGGESRTAVRPGDARPGCVQDLQRRPRPPGRRRPAGRAGPGHGRRPARGRPPVPLRRRRVRGHPARRRPAGRPRGRRPHHPGRRASARRPSADHRSGPAPVSPASRPTGWPRTSWWPSPTRPCTRSSRPIAGATRRSPIRTCGRSTRPP